MIILFAGGDLGWKGVVAVGFWLLLIVTVVAAVTIFSVRWLENKKRERRNSNMTGDETENRHDS
jgi:hypothetical protein